MNNVEDYMLLLPESYTGGYAQMVPQQGESKPRRRRKKSKGGDAGSAASKKRKLNVDQAYLLELNFGNEHKLESQRKDKLASELGLDPRQVAVWFQNRRARWKNKKLEEEYSTLKKEHDNNVVEKCRLESEVEKLKEQLSNAEKEIQRLSQRTETLSSNSASSSLSMNTMEPPFFGEFEVVEGYKDYFYMPAAENYPNGMDWINLY